MVLKTFSVDEEAYERFSDFCKENGLSMSRQIQIFIEFMVEEGPEVRQGYLKKLNKIRKGKFIKVKSFAERYGL